MFSSKAATSASAKKIGILHKKNWQIKHHPMSTFWENGAKYQEYKNKADARKTVILLFLFFTQKQMLSSCIWVPDVWEHDLVRWLYQIISGLKQCFRCCAMRFIAWVIHYPITWSIEAKSRQFFCCALRNLFSKCVYLPVFNYFKTSIQHFLCNISKFTQKCMAGNTGIDFPSRWSKHIIFFILWNTKSACFFHSTKVQGSCTRHALSLHGPLSSQEKTERTRLSDMHSRQTAPSLGNVWHAFQTWLGQV